MANERERPIVSVVIVSYNTRHLTLRCLTELYPDLGDMTAEVFVVDNGSTDGSVAAVRESFPKVELIEVGRNAGFGAANNMALRRATGEFMLLLNTDAFVRPGAVAALIDYLEKHPGTAVVGPRLLNEDGSLQPSCFRFPGPQRAFWEHTLISAAFPTHPSMGDYRAWPHDAEREVDYVIGACMLVRRSAMLKVGLFDEAFFMYSEETDWCRRFHKQGWAVAFTPSAEVMHLNKGSGKQVPDRIFNEYSRGLERYVRKHHGLIGLNTFRACMIGGSSLRVFIFGGLSLLPGRRTLARQRVREWRRILTWTLGKRGAGLGPN